MRVMLSTCWAIKWLEERGADFGGKATELNALLGPRSFR
jgi:hypothetical protein